MTNPRFTPLVQSLPTTVPFIGPEAHMRDTGRPFKARLGANESGFGPSPKAVKAMQDAAAEVWLYGDSESHDLRVALAAHHAVAPENIIVGEGIDGLLGTLVRMMVAEGDPVVTSDGAYPTFNYHVAGYGGVVHKVPYRDEHEDPAALLAMAEKTGAKLLYFCNPDNPMGSWHSARIVQRMIENLPRGTLMVLDEAYIEAAPEGTAPPLDPTNAQVIRMRTFSKLYGLAGLRIGYAIGAAPLIAAFERVRNHFGIGRLAQVGALAALQDQDWLVHVHQEIKVARQTLYDIAADNGFHALPSATNFVTIDCGRDSDFSAALIEEMMARDVFIRRPFAAQNNRCIRVSTAPAPELEIFARTLHDVLGVLR